MSSMDACCMIFMPALNARDTAVNPDIPHPAHVIHAGAPNPSPVTAALEFIRSSEITVHAVFWRSNVRYRRNERPSNASVPRRDGDYARRIVRDRVPPPRHMEVRANEEQVAPVDLSHVGIGHAQGIERDA